MYPLSASYFSFFFYIRRVFRLEFSFFSSSNFWVSSSISRSYFLWAFFREVSATYFFIRSSFNVFSLYYILSMGSWLWMISRTDCCGFLFFGLLRLWSSLFFYFFFSLNYSKVRGVSSFAWHFSRYFFYKSPKVAFFFSRISCRCSCLTLSDYKTSLFFLTSSISLVSLPPS